jgi:hypothetical protein
MARQVSFESIVAASHRWDTLFVHDMLWIDRTCGCTMQNPRGGEEDALCVLGEVCVDALCFASRRCSLTDS